MKSYLGVPIFILLVSTLTFSQTTPRATSTPSKVPEGVPIRAGTVPKPVAVKPDFEGRNINGRTYTSRTFNFEVTFPDTWLIPGDDFEEYMKKQGFDLGLKAPDSLPISEQAKINQAVKRVRILMTAYRSMPGATDNAIVRVSVEDLTANPQIKDAVDYFDAIRATYSTIKMPPDFKYSETQAEKLGTRQFAFLDTTNDAGKKRMYARVANGVAIMFTISYTKDEDLQTLRHVLEHGNFALK